MNAQGFMRNKRAHSLLIEKICTDWHSYKSVRVSKTGVFTLTCFQGHEPCAAPGRM